MPDNRITYGPDYHVVFTPHPSLPCLLFELRRTRDNQLLRKQVSRPCLADFQTAEAEMAGLAVPFAEVTHFGMTAAKRAAGAARGGFKKRAAA